MAIFFMLYLPLISLSYVMQYIGFHVGHDAGVAAINERGEVTFFGQVERYSRVKNHGFELDPIGRSFPNMPQASEDDVVVLVNNETYGDPKWRPCLNMATGDCGHDTRLVRPYRAAKRDNFLTKYIGKPADFALNHHLAHAITAWLYRPDGEERLFLVYDGAGHDAEGNLQCHLVGRISDAGFSMIDTEFPIPTSVPLAGLLGLNSAGKAMGLAGHMPKQEFTLDMTMQAFLMSVNDRFEPQYPNVPYDKLNDKNMQMIANFYRWYTGEIWKAVEANIKKYANGRGVVIGGGTTLALEVNTNIFNMTGEVVFAPPTDDSGLALGAAAFAYFHHTGRWPRLNTASLNALTDPLPAVGPQDPAGVARLVADNEVVGLMRGLGEAGPRALGFRSLLALPRADNLKRVSQHIKKREFYRPLAPMVTEEQFDRLFDGPRGEYMQYKVECTAEARTETPAVCHRDNSARPQVVSRQKDPWLHEMLVEVGRQTGVECVINTSLNGHNRPICNVYDDAARDFRGKSVRLVSLPHPAWEPPPAGRRLLMA